jgi:capsid protein
MRLAWRTIKPLTIWAATGSESAYEGTERNRYRYRPIQRLTSQDDDLDIGTREGLISEARDLCRKFGIANRIIRQFANYVVGSSYVKWLSADKEWNLRTEEEFWRWSQGCDYTQRLNLRKMARLAVMSRKRDGDVFFVERVDGGVYTLEPIEGDRVGNIVGQTNIDDLGARIVGGVKLDAAGRPISYRILARTRYGSFVNPVDVPRERCIHFTDSTRFDCYRGVTAFATALNDLRDLKETKDAERLKQKLSSKLALVVKNQVGGPMPGINPFGADTTRTEGNSVKTEEVGDVAIQYLFNGDSIEAHHSQSPGNSWFQLTEVRLRGIRSPT